MAVMRQFSVYLENKPGLLADIARDMAVAKVNIIALAVPESMDIGLLRMVVDQPGKAKSILKARGHRYAEGDVLGVQMPNRPGALSEVGMTLKKHKINIDYAYGSAAPQDGVTTIIFHVGDPLSASRIVDPLFA